MKFNEKYPDKTNPQKLHPNRLMGPYEELSLTPTLRQSWRTALCIVCQHPTSWRVVVEKVHAPSCSEECAAQISA